MTYYISFLSKRSTTEEAVKELIQQSFKGDFKFIDYEDHRNVQDKKGGKHVAIVIGGDGSLNFAVNKIISDEMSDFLSICYMPRGTGNDFSRVVGLHEMSDEQIIALVQRGSDRKISIGKINNTYFANMLSCGLFAEVTPEVDEDIKNLIGAWSYYFKGISMLGELTPWSCKFEIDGSESLEFSSLLGFFIGNSRYAGGGIQVTSDADPSDSQLDVLVIKNMSTPDLLALGLELQKDQPDLSAYNVLYRKFEKLKFGCEGSFKVSVDGEPSDFSSGSVGVIPKALNVFVPSNVVEESE